LIPIAQQTQTEEPTITLTHSQQQKVDLSKIRHDRETFLQTIYGSKLPPSRLRIIKKHKEDKMQEYNGMLPDDLRKHKHKEEHTDVLHEQEKFD
jgi:hypothetical protein